MGAAAPGRPVPAYRVRAGRGRRGPGSSAPTFSASSQGLAATGSSASIRVASTRTCPGRPRGPPGRAGRGGGLPPPGGDRRGWQARGAAFGDQDAASAPVGRIGTPLDQALLLEVVEQVGHHRAVHAEVLGQGQLAAHRALSRRRQHLVAPGAAGEIGQRGVRGRHVRAEYRAQAPAEIFGQRARTGTGLRRLPVACRVAHAPIIGPVIDSSVRQMFCRQDDLYSISSSRARKRYGPDGRRDDRE